MRASVFYCHRTSYCTLSRFKQHKFIILQFGDQKSEMGLTGLKPRCRRAVFLRKGLGRIGFLVLSHYRGLPLSWAPSLKSVLTPPGLCLYHLQTSLTRLPPSLTCEHTCDYTEPIWILQENSPSQNPLLHHFWEVPPPREVTHVTQVAGVGM